jgi:uncharacterized membrane protein YgcG
VGDDYDRGGANRKDEGARSGERFETKRGKIYHDAEVVSRDDYGIMIRHREGGARLAYSDLSKEVQERYNYDRDAADRYVKKHMPVRKDRHSSQHRPTANNFRGFAPQYAATRAHLAFAGGLLCAPFGGSLGVPGVKSFDAWQTFTTFAPQNPYHSSHRYRVKSGDVYLSNRRQSDSYNVGHHYGHAFKQNYARHNPYSYLNNGLRYGNPIAPAMSVGHTRATNSGNPVAPAMMSWGQYQDARARAIPHSLPTVRGHVRLGGGGGGSGGRGGGGGGGGRGGGGGGR